MSRKTGAEIVFRAGVFTFVRVSLNRSEQMIFDYVQSHPEERQFWVEKVKAVGAARDFHAAALELEAEWWAYYKERSAVVPSFRSQAAREGLPRTSMRNLAEHVLRLWCPPKPKPRSGTQLPSSI